MVSAGVMVALGQRPAARVPEGVMRRSHGCATGSVAMVWFGAMAVVAVQMRSGSAAECKVTASLLVVCIKHWCVGLARSVCCWRKSDACSGRYRVGIACRELSCKRVIHSVTLRVTEDGECCMPPCSNNRRRN